MDMDMDVQTALDMITEDATRGNLFFSSHTKIALLVQRALDEPDCSIDQLSKLISAEPMLAAKVVNVANSVAYNPSGRVVTGVRQALSRLSFNTLRTLVAAVVVRQMQEMSPSAEGRALATDLWQHTAHVAALARVLAEKVTKQDPEAAFFTGIMHEAGNFYLIARAVDFPGLLDGPLETWCGENEARVGHAVLSALGVPAPVIEAISVSWQRHHAMPPRSLGDTLLWAEQLSPIESPLAALTGMGSKGMIADVEQRIGDKLLSQLLEEAAAEVNSLIDMLSA